MTGPWPTCVRVSPRRPEPRSGWPSRPPTCSGSASDRASRRWTSARSHGLMPMVVPQLKTITLGGAIAGLGIESSSFRNGMPHESVLEMEILTGDGQIVVARPDNEHAELFHAFPNSYGT